MNHVSQDPLLQSLEFLGKYHGKSVNLAGAIQGLPLRDGRLEPDLFEDAAERCGFASQIVQRRIKDLHPATLPAVLLMQGNDTVILLGFPNKKTAEVVVPSAGHGTQKIAIADLEHRYTGMAILVKPKYQFESRASFEPDRLGKNWFWGTLYRFKSFYARVAIATVVINFLALTSSLFIMNVYDRVVPNQAVDTLYALAFGALAAFILEFALKTLRTFFVDRAGHRIDLILGGELYSRVLGLQYGAKPQSAGALAGQARSYEGLREFFTSATLSAMVDLPFVFVFAAIVFMMGGVAAIPLLVGAVFALAFGAIMQVPISHAVSSSYKAGNQRQALFVEGVNALETIKATRSESELQARMEDSVHISARADGKARCYSQLALNVTALTQQMVTVGIVVVAFYQVQAEAMTMGAMIACVILSGRAMAPLTMVSSLLTRLQQSRKSLAGLNQIMEAPGERQDRGAQYISLERFVPQIRIKNVGFGYGEDSDGILNDLNITIEPGERVALLGRIGSGKSTLLRQLMALYHPTSGRIDIAGIDTRQLDPAELRRHIGYVSQDPTPLFGTIRSNVKAGCPWATDMDVWIAIERAGLAEYVRSLPRGLDHPIAEGGKSLSGGQRQAISFARAMLEDPALLILDEPTSAMDFSSEQQLLGQLDDYLNHNPLRTLVVATHKRAILSIVERVIVMENGRVVADGPRDQVISKQNSRKTGVGAMNQEPTAQPKRNSDEFEIPAEFRNMQIGNASQMPDGQPQLPTPRGGMDDVALLNDHSPAGDFATSAPSKPFPAPAPTPTPDAAPQGIGQAQPASPFTTQAQPQPQPTQQTQSGADSEWPEFFTRQS